MLRGPFARGLLCEKLIKPSIYTCGKWKIFIGIYTYFFNAVQHSFCSLSYAEVENFKSNLMEIYARFYYFFYYFFISRPLCSCALRTPASLTCSSCSDLCSLLLSPWKKYLSPYIIDWKRAILGVFFWVIFNSFLSFNYKNELF